jgi:hypothetical protein
MNDRPEEIAAVAQTKAAAARAVAASLSRRRKAKFEPFSLAEYLASLQAPSRIVLCPAGRSVGQDIEFLAEASRRALWPAPDEILAEAIEGFRGSHSPHAAALPRSAVPAAAKRGRREALLLEGMVSSARARKLAETGARSWIVETPRHVRIESALYDRLEALGIRWLALEPVTVEAVLARPALARAHARWKRLLPPGTSLWIPGPVRRS